MTYFIIETDNTTGKKNIVGTDEFYNEAYLRELNIGKSNTISYGVIESTNPCNGYNDGTYYIDQYGAIAWKSCETVSIPTPIPEPMPQELQQFPVMVCHPTSKDFMTVRNEEAFNSATSNGYVTNLELCSPTIPILPQKNTKVITLFIGEPLDRLIGNSSLFFRLCSEVAERHGWAVEETIGENGEIRILATEEGSDPITAIVFIVIGLIALWGIITQIRYSIRDYYTNQIQEEGVKTQSDAVSNLKEMADEQKRIIDNPNSTAEQKAAAEQLLKEINEAIIKIETERGIKPIPDIPDLPKDEGIFGQLKPLVYGILAVALVIAAINFIPRKN